MSQTYGPFDVRPGVLQRSTRFVDLVTRQRPGTTALRLWASTSIEAAYGTLATSGLAGSGGTLVGTAQVTKQGSIAATATVISRGWRVEESRRGQTSFQLDPEDLAFTDETLLFFRLQEQRAGAWLAVAGVVNTAVPIMGPILICPTAAHYGTAAAVLGLQATAPANTTCTAGANPVVDSSVQIPLPLHLVMPRPAATLTITNQSGTDDLLVSFGLGMPMFTIAPGVQSIPTGGGYSLTGVREIVVAAAGATAVPFSLEVVVAHERG